MKLRRTADSAGHSRLTVSDTVTIDEHADGDIKMMEFRKSAIGHLIAYEGKGLIGYYLEGIIEDMNLQQKAHGTLASSEMHSEPVVQLVILTRRAVLLC